MNAKNDVIIALMVELQFLKQIAKQLQRPINENDSRESEGQSEGKYNWKTDEERVVGDELCEGKTHPPSFRPGKMK